MAALVLLALSLAVGWATHRSPAGPEESTAAPSAEAGPVADPRPVPEPPRRSPDPARVDRAEVGRGGTLDSALDRAGVPEDLRPEVVAAFGSRLDLRRLPARTGVATSWADDGRLLAVSCRPSVERIVRVELDRVDGPSVEEDSLEVLREVETVSGTVRQSLAQALEHHPMSTALVAAVADIFQWDVDLLVDPRPGDEVRVVFEVLHVGDVPADLPTFGDAGSVPGEVIGLGRVLAASFDGSRADAEAFWVADGESGGYYDGAGRPVRKTFLKSPLNYRRISSGFSRARRNPVTRKVVPHHGVDFAAPTGTPVASSADGRVVSAGWDGALGRAVRIRHGSEYTTVYGHLSRIARGIRRGADVRQGDVIGYVGATGRATGPHLHYAMYRGGAPVNPLTFENPPVGPLPERLRTALDAARSAWIPVLASLRPTTHEGSMAVSSSGAPEEGQADPRPLFR